MAKRWRGCRLITVNGRRFRWKCDFNEPLDKSSVAYARNGHEWAPDRLIVLLEESPNHVLTVTWPACDAPVIRPRDIRAVIQAAMDRKWLESEHSLNIWARDIWRTIGSRIVKRPAPKAERPATKRDAKLVHLQVFYNAWHFSAGDITPQPTAAAL